MSATAPVFTLPNTVLFPGVVIPLHIFETKYRNMIADIETFENHFILSFAARQIGHKLVPSKHACLAEVLYIEELKNGRSNIVIEGKDYVVLEHLSMSQREYMLSDYHAYDIDATSQYGEVYMREAVVDLVKQITLNSLNYNSTTLELIHTQYDIDIFLNKIIYFFLFPHSEQQKLLESRSVERKFEYLKSYLSSVLNDLMVNLETFNIPEYLAKKLN